MTDNLEQLESRLESQLTDIKAQLEAVKTTRRLLGGKPANSQQNEITPTSGRPKFGAVADAVKAAISELPDRFTLADVEKTLEKSGQTYNAASVRTAVNRLRGILIDIAKQGAGRRASKYKKMEKAA
jgi:hypothetical protein